MLIFETPPENIQVLLQAGTSVLTLRASYSSSTGTGNLTITQAPPLTDGRIPVTVGGFPAVLPNGRYTISLTNQEGVCCYKLEMSLVCPPITSRPTHHPTDIQPPACCP